MTGAVVNCLPCKMEHEGRWTINLILQKKKLRLREAKLPV